MQGNTDCCFRSGNDWFRYRVGAIIISGEYALFADSGEGYFYSVGGGVHVGEHSCDGVLEKMHRLPIARLDEYDIRPKIAVRLAKEPPMEFSVFVNEQRSLSGVAEW